MKMFWHSRQLALFILLTLLSSPDALCQAPHVHTEYLEKGRRTRVYTDAMHVIDTPSQFMLVELSSSYPKQQLVKPPDRIFLRISSITKKVLYRQSPDTAPKVIITGDGESLKFDRPSRLELKGGTWEGREVFWLAPIFPLFLEPKDKGLAFESPLPEGGQVRAGKGVEGLYMEQIALELKPMQLLKIANAQNIEVELGGTRFGFTKNHMSTIRDFARRLTP